MKYAKHPIITVDYEELKPDTYKGFIISGIGLDRCFFTGLGVDYDYDRVIEFCQAYLSDTNVMFSSMVSSFFMDRDNLIIEESVLNHE